MVARIFVILVVALSLTGCWDEWKMEQECSYQIKKRLRAPDTAKLDHQGTTREGDLFTITYDVRSQNGFGGWVRRNITCRIEAHEPGDFSRYFVRSVD
jgi:hypothetical protein